MTRKELKEYFAKVGQRGGKAAARNRTAEERKQHARKAAQARWAKQKGEVFARYSDIGTKRAIATKASKAAAEPQRKARQRKKAAP